jgi:hypothetical protein
MNVSLCMPPASGEPRELVRFDLAGPFTVLEVPARHLVDRVEHDPQTGALALWLEVASERARPVHVRVDFVEEGGRTPPLSHHLASVESAGRRIELFGSYLGVVSNEN